MKQLVKESRVKKIIDLADGAKILGKDEAEAQKILECFVAMLPEVCDALHNAYCARGSDPETFRFMTDKLYGGVVYVGIPALRQAMRDLLIAVNKEEEGVDRLYQQVLDEIEALKKEIKTSAS